MMRARSIPFLVALGLLALSVSSLSLAAEPVPVRVGAHPGFGRVVFDWGGRAQAELQAQTESRAVIRFDRAGELDLSRFDADPPPGLRTLVPVAAEDGLQVTVTFVAGSKLRLFESEGSIVLDVLAPTTPVDAAAVTSEQWRRQQVGDRTPDIATEVAAMVPARKPLDDQATPETATSPSMAPADAAPPSPEQPIRLLPPDADAPADAAEARASVSASEKSTDSKSGMAQPTSDPAKPPAARPADSAESATRAGAPVAAAPPAAKAAPKPTADKAKIAATVPPATPPSNFARSPWLAAELRGQPSPGIAGALRKRPAGLARVVRAAPEAILAARTLDLGGPIALRFPFSAATAAAAFRRGSHLWLVFDREITPDLVADLETKAPELAPFSRFEVPGGTLLRMTAPGLRQPYLRRDSHDWIVEIVSVSSRTPEAPRVEVDGAAQPAEVRFHLAEPGEVISFTDPDRLDRIAVVPLRRAGLGFERARAFPQFRVLESLQGLVLQPLSEGFSVSVDADVARVRDRDGLVVSYGGTLAVSLTSDMAPRRGPRLFDLESWRRGGPERYQTDRHALLSDLARAEPARLNVARQALARFYFAHGLATETRGLLDLRVESDTRLGQDPEALLLAGASEFLEGDYESAARHILDPALDGEAEADLWRAALAAVGLDWATAARFFEFSEPLIGAYPRPVRTRLRLLAAESNLAVENVERAEAHFDRIRADRPNRLEQAQLAFLVGRRHELAGETDAAREIWKRVAKSDHASSRARARLALLDLDVAGGAIGKDELIAELERLRFAWRGDRFEFTVIRRLAELYFDGGDHRQGLRALRQLASRVADDALAQAAAQRMREVFAEVFLGGLADRMTPLKALALYEEFKELTPTGPDGDRIVAELAERLIAVDLLDRAAQVLAAQVDYRLTGGDKARAGLRLAQIRLLNRQPEMALRALDRSDSSGPPDDLAAQRRRTRAEALLERGRGDEALAALEGDSTSEALRLRAEILWRQGDWPAAALVLAQLVPDAPPARPLNDAQSDMVMKLAVASTMAGDAERLATLNAAYGEAMKGTESASAFAVLVRESGTGAGAPIARQLAEVAEFETFLADYRAGLKSGAGN